MPPQQCAADPTDTTLLDDVLDGLTQTPKTLPCKYLYDDRGSRLFEQICELDEYYLTRTELSILENHGDAIMAHCGPDTSIIEPGAGAGRKVAILLKALGGGRCFVPLEISAEALQMSEDYLAPLFPGLSIRPIHGDFTDSVDVRLAAEQLEPGPRLVFFPGSTLGNFEPANALSVLRNLRRLMGDDGSIVMGLDLIKDEARLLAAYNDPRGITAAFNKNLLYRINRELNADFDCENGFEHRAVFNRELGRIEMHLCATRSQTVTVAEREIAFAAGESIHTENSHKYSLPTIEALCRDAQLYVDSYWTDDNADFGVFRLQRIT